MPMLFHHKLQFISGDLTASEQKVAAYIDEHRESVRGMSSSALAEASGVSQPTIIRFSKKLGYGSYRQMINDVGVENADEFINMDVSETDDTATTTALLAQQYNTIVNMTLSMNSIEDIDLAGQAVYQARKVMVAGYSERNYYLSEYICYRLENIGIDSFTNSHSSLLYARLLNCEVGDVLIVLSESGETRDLVNFAKLARKKGMSVISITRSAANTIQSLSNVNFKVMEYGARTFLRSCMLRLSMNCIVDALFLNLIKLDYSDYRTRSVKLNQMTKLSYEVPDPNGRKIK